MNLSRVRGRRMQFDEHAAGSLHDYRLAFNKRSVKFPGAASANVASQEGAVTEGVLYRLQHPEQIKMMDPFEGYPLRYDRIALPIVTREKVVDAWVYIANTAFVAEGLQPARWYLEHLLAGKDFLSTSYYEQLTTVECLPDSHIEPG